MFAAIVTEIISTASRDVASCLAPSLSIILLMQSPRFQPHEILQSLKLTLFSFGKCKLSLLSRSLVKFFLQEGYGERGVRDEEKEGLALIPISTAVVRSPYLSFRIYTPSLSLSQTLLFLVHSFLVFVFYSF